MQVQPRRRTGTHWIVAGAVVLEVRDEAAVRVVVDRGGPQALDSAHHHRAPGPRRGPTVPIQPSLTFAAEQVTLWRNSLPAGTDLPFPSAANAARLGWQIASRG